jgi:hypothetical protein
MQGGEKKTKKVKGPIEKGSSYTYIVAVVNTSSPPTNVKATLLQNSVSPFKPIEPGKTYKFIPFTPLGPMNCCVKVVSFDNPTIQWSTQAVVKVDEKAHIVYVTHYVVGVKSKGKKKSKKKCSTDKYIIAVFNMSSSPTRVKATLLQNNVSPLKPIEPLDTYTFMPYTPLGPMNYGVKWFHLITL